MGHASGRFHLGFGQPSFARGFHDGDFRSRGFHHGFGHHFGFRRFGYPWYGYGYYSPFWWDSSYADDYRFDEPQAREIELANEMDRINLEEQALRQREAMLAYGQNRNSHAERPVHAEMSPPPPIPTVLVFRDQHQQEVENYAIYGSTLLVLNEQTAKKIPLAQLDLEATRKINDERGVEFAVPR
jgi:hypothetical protein